MVFLGEIYHEVLHLVMDDGVIPIKSFLTFCTLLMLYVRTDAQIPKE